MRLKKLRVEEERPPVDAGGMSLRSLRGRAFYKMCGSGNDFVFFDVRGDNARAREQLGESAAVRALCARSTGVGADGIVLLDRPQEGGVRIAYFNSDGTRADLCGNATLCTATLAVTLALVDPSAFVIATDAGPVRARVDADGPQIELARVTDVVASVVPTHSAPGEVRVGYAKVGIPHLVVEVQDLDAVDVARRGAQLRAPTAERPAGANVNFVGPAAETGGRRIRTFERGVEGETLACGTGAVAAAALLTEWRSARDASEVALITKSSRSLWATIPDDRTQAASLRGEGRLVFSGTIGDLY